jgi:hypothetical protein
MFMNRKQNEEQLFLPTLFAVIQCLILISAYNVGRVGFHDVLGLDTFKTLGCSFFVVTLPFHLSFYLQKNKTQQWYNSLAIHTIITLLFLVVINIICLQLQINLSLVLPVFGYLLFLSFFIHLAKVDLAKSMKVMLLPAILFAFWSVGDIWGRVYQNVLYFEGLAVGKGHIDTLFHTDIAQMIKTYAIPSTGIDGLVFNPYHFGSHILAESLSSLLHIPSIKVYNFVFPLIYAPLYIYSFLLAIFSIKKLYNNTAHYSHFFWFVILIGLDGVLPERITGSEGISHWLFSGESYAVSILFSMLIIGTFIEFWKQQTVKEKMTILDYFFLLVAMPVLLILIGFLKISVLCLLIGASAYLFLRLRLFKQAVYLVAFAMYCIIFYWVFTKTSPANKDNQSYTTFYPFSFVFSFVKGWWLLLFMPVYYLGPIVYTILRLHQEGVRNIKTLIQLLKTRRLAIIDVEILLVFALMGFAVIATLNIPGGSVAYFSDYQRKFAVVLLAVWALNNSANLVSLFPKVSKRMLMLMSAILLYIFFNSTFEKVRGFYQVNKGTREAIIQTSGRKLPISTDELIKEPQIALLKNVRYNMLQDLMKIDSLPTNVKKNSLLFIPQTDTLFWKALPANRISFLAPAITGIAMIDGTPPISDSERLATPFYFSYFYPYYQFRKKDQNDSERMIQVLLEKVRAKHRKTLIVYSAQNGKYSIHQYE